MSMSQPLMVNTKRFLKSYSNTESPSPIHGFVDVTFHELIHNFLDENFDPSRSILIKKYKNEDDSVLAHIHLMALQKALYNNLNRPEMIEWIEVFYKQIGKSYLRSWEIVNKLENYQEFVKEVKTLKSK